MKKKCRQYRFVCVTFANAARSTLNYFAVISETFCLLGMVFIRMYGIKNCRKNTKKMEKSLENVVIFVENGGRCINAVFSRFADRKIWKRKPGNEIFDGILFLS